jgi:hypothetical protein
MKQIVVKINEEEWVSEPFEDSESDIVGSNITYFLDRGNFYFMKMKSGTIYFAKNIIKNAIIKIEDYNEDEKTP